MPTIKQQRAAKLMIEEKLKGERGRNKGQILREAGYGENKTKKPTHVTESVGYKEAEAVEEKKAIDHYKEKLDMVFNALNKGKVNKANAEGLVRMADICTKNIQLLGGGATENVNFMGDFLKEIDGDSKDLPAN